MIVLLRLLVKMKLVLLVSILQRCIEQDFLGLLLSTTVFVLLILIFLYYSKLSNTSCCVSQVRFLRIFGRHFHCAFFIFKYTKVPIVDLISAIISVLVW